MGSVTLTIVALTAFALLLLAPNRLASMRLGEVALAWWALGAVALLGLVAVGRGLRDRDPADAPPTEPGWLVALMPALAWGSPALWLGLPPLLWDDGVRGLWPAAAAIGGAVVAMLLLGTPLVRADGTVARTSAVAWVRWPAGGGCHTLLGALEALVAGLFVWAQLTAVRELGAAVGWPRLAAIGAAVGVALAAALLPERSWPRLAAWGGALALLGLAVPLALVALATTTGWPGVWSAVASRSRIAFIEGSPWTLDGRTVRGPSAGITMRFADEQRVTFADAGRVILEDPRPVARDVQAGDEASLHPGDRLTVPDGMRLRFEPGRRVPDAPDSGPAWVEPPLRATTWLGLLGLGVTGLLGPLGLPAGARRAKARGAPPRRGAQVTAGLVIAGAGLAVAWSLYAAWLTPEVYAGGVAGAEVYGLPAGVAALGEWGRALAGGALIALGLGAAASALAAFRPLAGQEDPAPRWARRRAALFVMGAGALACLASVGSWTVLLLALGVAASTLAPAAALVGWSRRATPGGIAVGATVGLLTFVVVAAAGAFGSGRLEDQWWTAVAAGPAAVAVPAHILVAWALRSRQTASQRLPAGLDGLTATPPARTG